MTMSHIDAITRFVASAVGRRSLLAIGAAGLGAVLPASSVVARNKGRRHKKRCKKRLKRTCSGQVTACRAFFQEFCEDFGSPEDIAECRQTNFACCEEFSNCRLDAYLACLQRQIDV